MTIQEFDMQVALGLIETFMYWKADEFSTLIFTITLDGVKHDLSPIKCRKAICCLYEDQMEDAIFVSSDSFSGVHVSINRLRAKLIKEGILT